MSNIEKLASQNAPEIDNAANEAASNESNNDIKKMKQNIDWTALMGNTAVAQPKTIDPQVVIDIFTSFLSIPTEVNVSFKNDEGYLKMTVNMNFREKFIRNFETLADYKLVACTVAAMGGTIPAPEGLFVQFLNSPFRCHIEPDFVSAKGERFFCASFAPGYRKVIRFCLKRTEELENVIQRFINDAVHAA